MNENRERNIFATFIFEKIKDRKVSLREISRKSGIDVAHLSRLYRGVMYPPRKQEILDSLALALGLSTTEKETMIERAKHVNGQLINELDNVRGLSTIPLLFRAIDNKKLTED